MEASTRFWVIKLINWILLKVWFPSKGTGKQREDTVHFGHPDLQCLEYGRENYQGKIKTNISSKRKKNKRQINYPPELHRSPWNIFLKTHTRKFSIPLIS